MDAGFTHRGDRRDGFFQFAFQRALIVDLLGELADAEFLVIHQFEADRAVLRQTLRRQAQAGFVYRVAGNQDRAARFGNLVGNIALLERRDHITRPATTTARMATAMISGMRGLLRNWLSIGMRGPKPLPPLKSAPPA